MRKFGETTHSHSKLLFAVLLCAVLVCVTAPLSAQSASKTPSTSTTLPAALSPSAEKVLSASFALKDQDAVIKSLVTGAAKADKSADRKILLASLADFEERSGRPADAAKHFNESAFSEPPVRDDGLLLDSARCLLVTGDTAGADALVRAVLLTCFDQTTLVRARVYSAWIQLSSGDRAGALTLIRSYAATSAFSPFAPALLFTLWWSDSDAIAKKTLLDSFPSSPEASIARGDSSLSAAPFWFLMDRSSERVALFAKDGAASLPTIQPTAPVQSSATPVTTGTPATPATTATTATTAMPVSTATPATTGTPATTTTPATTVSATGRWQQTGFFKVREYADELQGKLKKAGFDAVIREEKRPSGTVYFSVLVPETTDRTAGDRLKDAGFESYLVID